MLRDPFDAWSSWREVERLRREMNQLFDRPGRFAPSGAANFPAMNVWTNEEGVLVTAELPGIDPNDLDISVRENVLTVKGVRNPLELKEGESYHRRERGYGQFQRVFQLPFSVNASGVEAMYENGVLRLRLPRAEEDKPRKISVVSG
ncbi:MAG: Hsp20/alpha crystallin family protein [Anaerolineae bacterium]|nr:Hsp20/alpha crystallin family protein [Anaerolineae bacterium]